MSATLHFANDVRMIATDGDLNMCNRNARIFLAGLGLPLDFDNEPPMPIAEFKSALERFRQSEIDQVIDRGRDAVVIAGQNATMIECGLRGGYLKDRVGEAWQLTVEAEAKGATKVYFA